MSGAIISGVAGPAIISTGEAQEMLRLIRQWTAIIHWRTGPWDLIPQNGSGFFVQTEKALFGVTAKHVFEAFEDTKNRFPTVIAEMLNLRINLRARLISKGVDADVATFEILPCELQESRLSPVPWPPFLAQEGKTVLVGGYPGIGKRVTGPKEITFGIYHALARVDSVNHRDISMVRPPNEEMQDLVGKGLPPQGLDMGGMSGGPVVSPILEPSGESAFGLSGVIYECGSAFDIVKAVRAEIIDDYGIIHG